MKTAHILYCPFTGLGLHGGYRGDKWLKNRIKVFNRFVIPSLMNQSNKDFILWFSWRHEDFKNQIVADFIESLQGIRGITSIHTYSGVCFWDDKHEPEYEANRLYNALEGALMGLKALDELREAETIYMTIQPSDDLYAGWVVQGVHESGYKNGAFGFTKGYIMNYGTLELAEYNPKTPPPFYTIAFPNEIFFDAEKHYAYIGPYTSHEYVKDFMELRESPLRGFLVGTHGENISTTFNHPYKGRVIEGEEREKILFDFGLWGVEPVTIRKPARLLVRRMFNTLPFNDIIRKTYHKLPAPWQVF